MGEEKRRGWEVLLSTEEKRGGAKDEWRDSYLLHQCKNVSAAVPMEWNPGVGGGFGELEPSNYSVEWGGGGERGGEGGSIAIPPVHSPGSAPSSK